MAAVPVPFQAFFQQQAPLVGRFLATMVPPDEVEECLQETFIAALRAYERFDGANPRGWIVAIARRKAIDSHRERSRRPVPAGQVPELAAAEWAPPQGGPLDGELWQQVAALPEKQRAALVLRYAFDLRHREIGAALGCSDAAARRSVHEGITKLREQAAAKEAT